MRKFTLGFLLIFLCFNLMAQDRVITGIVTDPSGKPLRDVSVVLKGTNAGTVTGADGSFLLTVPSTARTLVFSAINMRPQELAIGTGNVVNASLDLADQSLQEVVVTALGVRREKRSLGYSVSEVNAEDLTRVPNQNVINSLNGKVAGLQVIASGGAPGMASRVVIRGGNKSFRPTGSDPLVVVDGIPISNVNDGNSNTVAGVATPNRAGDINPDDIESISVLKGGAASVLYGSRGANGVMLITTKSGKNRGGKPAITFSTTTGMDEALRLPHFQKTFAQGQLIGGVPTYAEGTSTSFGPRITGQTVNSTGAGGPITLRVFDPRADFLRQGLTLNNNLSFSQSTDRGTYFLSVGHSAQTSIVPNQEYNKANLRFNVSNNLTSKLTAGANINYIKSWGDVPYTGQDGNNPIFGLFNMPVTWDINGYGFEYPDGSQKNFRGGAFDNPLWSVNRSFYNTSADRFIGNVNFGYQLSPWINLTYKFGGDLSTDYRKAFRDLKTGGSPNGFLSNDDVFRQELNSTFLANFQRRLNKDIGFTLTVGHDFNQRTLRQIIQSVSSLTLPRVAHMSNGKDINPNVENLANQRLTGVLGDLQVDFKNYFFLGLRGRNEWSSTLPADNRSYFYPGVNGSFVFTDAFKLSGNVLSYGKLRGGYAKTARDAPPYNTVDVFTPAIFGDGFTSGITFPFGSVPGYTVSNTIRNPFLQPEFTKEFEVGGELRFLKSRLNLDVTYFRNVNDNNIVVVNISPATGATGSVLNTGKITNKGLELGLNAAVIKARDFTWDVSVVFSRIRSKVEETYPGLERISLGGFSGNPAIFAILGERFGSIVGSKLLRNERGDVLINPTSGRPLFENGANLGYIEADWTGGIKNEFSFKGFTLDFLIDTRQGGFLFNGTGDLLDQYGVSKKTESREEDFIYPGVRSTDGRPNDKVVKRDQNWWSAAKVNEEYVYENNWTKLRELNVGYTFSLPNSRSLKTVNVSLYGRNLFLWTKIPHADPESSSFGTSAAQGVTRMAFPSTRSTGVNLKLTF